MFDPASFKRLGPIVAIAWSLPAATTAGALLGWMVDRQLGSGPVLTLLGGAAGFGWVVVQMLRSPPPPPDAEPPHPDP